MHLEIVHIQLSPEYLSEQHAALFVCALSKTCKEHFTGDAFDKVESCYICEQDYCNAFIDVPLQYTSSRSHYLRKHLIAFCYSMTVLFSFLIMK